MDKDHAVAVDLLGNGQQVSSGPRASKSLKGIRKSSRKFWLLFVVTLLQLNFAHACVDISKRTGSKPGIPIPDSALNEQLLALQLNSPWHDSAVGSNQVCDTKECVHAAYNLLFGINRAADPCYDFYDFACGNWEKLTSFGGWRTTTISRGSRSLTMLSFKLLMRPAESYDCFQAMKTAAVFFQQCVNASESDCLLRTFSFFAAPIMHEYLKTPSNLEALTVLNQMIANTLATFNKVLENNRCLSEAGKLAAQKRLSALKTFIGYPNWLLNTTEIESSFEMIQLGSNFSETLASINKVSREYNLNLLSKGKAFNDLNIDLIFLPLGLLHPHGFHNNVPSYVNYGRIGAVIGHEFSHGFRRRSLDENENAQSNDPSWTYDDKQNYEEKSNCYVDQYNKFEIWSGIYVNGSGSLDENVADNSGIKIAYVTYKEHYARNNDDQRLPGFEKLSVERLFFLSYGSLWCENEDVATLKHRALADPHSPGKYRTNGVLQNSPEFANAWNCPLRSPMNPINKCTLW